MNEHMNILFQLTQTAHSSNRRTVEVLTEDLKKSVKHGRNSLSGYTFSKPYPRQYITNIGSSQGDKASVLYYIRSLDSQYF